MPGFSIDRLPQEQGAAICSKALRRHERRCRLELGATTKAGDEIVAHHTLYGCTYSLFTHWLPSCAISVRFADLRDEQSFKETVASP